MTMLVELHSIDRHFADFITEKSGKAGPFLWTAVALLSRAVQSGDICLNLADIAGRELRIDGKTEAVPGFEELNAVLSGFPTVGRPGEYRPLVLDRKGRLYLYRYWRYENDLAVFILQKAASGVISIDRDILASGLERLFPETPNGETDWQKVAALAALRKGIAVISGGPGTGKTSTVVRIIALLLEQAQARHHTSGGPPMRIVMAAPTGKSASRLRESVVQMSDTLACDQAVKGLLPREVLTIHRLLGTIPGSTRFRYSRTNPLPADAVIIDEASMVALPLMAALVAALKPEARLIIIGDRDQLSSVEAGAVLGDICGNGREEVFSEEFAELAGALTGANIPAFPAGKPLPPLADALVILRKNYRFPAESGIGRVAGALINGRGKEAASILRDDSFPDVVWRDIPAPEHLRRALTEVALDGYSDFLRAETIGEALRLFGTFRFLCALNGGIYGVEGLNVVIEAILSARGLISPQQRWYRGRPVLVRANDYNLKLFNGDIGITFPAGDDDGGFKVFFPAEDGGVRGFSPFALPAHETCYAMTIHKSQGSEFDRVELILPPGDSALLTRELLYTGITRAKKGVTVWGQADIFVEVAKRRIDRKSGLSDALWPAGDETGVSL